MRILAGNRTSRAVGLRLAYASITIVVLLGVYVLFWIFQIKELGVSFNWTGELLSVRPGTLAADAGLKPGDYISFNDYQALKQFSGEARVGQLIQVEVFAREGDAAARRLVTLEALPGTISRQFSLGVEAAVGILFAVLGAAPLVARRRGLSLWLFFVATQLTALFLITDVPRSYHQVWAEVIAYTTYLLFPAVLFHFHTLFPQPRLGQWRNRAVTLVYVAAGLLLPLNLVSIWDYSFYVSDTWQFIIGIYLAVTLLACLVLLVRTFARTRDAKVRTQVKLITLCSSLGLFSNAILWIPSIAFNLDPETDAILKSLSVFTALSVPVGYAYAMLRHNLLIGGVLWRPSLIKVIYGSILSLGLVLFAAFVWPLNQQLTGPATLSVWVGLVILVVVVASLYEYVGRWTEAHLFRGVGYIDLLASATDELGRFRNLNEYVYFFTEQFPARLKSIGSLVFLAEEPSGSLTLQGHSASLILPVSVVRGAIPPFSRESELRSMLQSAHGPVALSTLLMPATPELSSDDVRILEILKTVRVEWLLPLTSSQQHYVIGLVALGAKETDEPYSGQELTALAALARTASISAENVLMFEALQRQLVELDQEREYSAALARDVSAAQELERSRISVEIHDTVVQELGVALRLLMRLRDELQQALGGLEDSQIALERLSDPAYAEEPAPIGEGARRELQSMLDECQSALGLLLGEASENTSDSGSRTDGSHGSALSSPLSVEAPNGDVAGKHLVEDILGLVRTTNQRLRDICTDLHPAYLDVPLVRTLSRNAERFGQLNRGVEVKFKVTGTEPADLDDNIKAVCKEVMDQAVHNALNHARPSGIEVVLSFATSDQNRNGLALDAVTLSVVDDGIGFEPRTPSYWRSVHHHGLANIYGSAALIGGTLHIDSGPGMGTRVNLHIPLDTIGSPDLADPPRIQSPMKNATSAMVAFTPPRIQ
ncbi:MAG: hypothetical protein IVW55_00365 [Chloroflexi bacterium]|nr:hypothetical protein [Chloroflexota bacterium]